MFTSLNEFAAEWKNESASTQRVLSALTDASLNQRVAQDHRTLGRLAWHLAVTIHEMMSRTGLVFESPGEEEQVPTSAKEIAEAYRRTSEAFLNAIMTQWTDESLKQTNNMYGEEWPNHVTLRILIQHEVHHRGQMTVLMRQAGLRVPGVYGPSLEEWQEMGMPAPQV